jgi:hypothetical protein
MGANNRSKSLLGVVAIPLTGLLFLLIGLLPGGQVGGLTIAAAEQPAARRTPTPIPAISRAIPLTTTTPTPTIMPTPTATTLLSITVEVVPAATLVAYGAPLTVAVAVRDESVGCQYPLYDLTLRQAGDGAPLFRHDSPAVLGPPGPHTAVYRLTAIAPGVITFMATAYGEVNCGQGWQWHYETGASGPVTVTTPAGFALLPFIYAADDKR